MIMYSHRQHALGMRLADYIIIKHFENFARCRHAIIGFDQRGFALFADNVHAQLDTFITDEHGRARNQLANFVLALAAKRAIEGAFAIAAAAAIASAANFTHSFSPFISPLNEAGVLIRSFTSPQAR